MSASIPPFPSAAPGRLPHALDRVPLWAARWRRAGQLVLLLDFDGTLAPIAERPDQAAMHPRAAAALRTVLARCGVRGAVVSGRALHDVRRRVGLPGLAYAGNHGMEIEGPGVRWVHPGASGARHALERARDRVAAALRDAEGALVEDKGLTLSVHHRRVARTQVERVRRAVLDAVAGLQDLRVTTGKEVLEIRPTVSWDKGRAVEFLLRHLQPPVGAPVLYLGDDVTDEDAFRLLRGGLGEGVVVADPAPRDTAATAALRDPDEVAALLEALASAGGR